ncbi:MAG: CDP-alcohol phosphatidyltransferase family protein [Anaerolineae bacterium]|nr:CDP-alcohol phosphatidyltransferase family protein [Anaerolineae bacterium]
MTFTDLLRKRFKHILDPAAAFLNSLGLMPNTVTIAGLVGNIGAAYLLATGHITWGGIVVLLMGPIDALDGTMARLRGEPTKFGGFVDSVTDRYSELVIFLGLLVFFLQRQDWLSCVGVFLATAGSVMVSYIRARAQSAGMDTKVGLFTRVERFLVLAPCLIFNLPLIAVWAIALFANITAFQRIWHVRQQAYEQMNGKPK